MYKLDSGAVTVIAGDSQAALAATDHAMRAHAQLMISFSEGTGKALPIGVSQDVLASVHAAQADILKSRGQLRRTIALLTSIQHRSNQSETNFGCPVGFPFGAIDGIDGVEPQGGIVMSAESNIEPLRV